MREIQVQARLHHPNIAAVYNAFRSGPHFAMIMELVEGESLQSLLERGSIAVQTGIDYARQVLGALAYAHAEGVIHRDVTPANIIINGSGDAKLTDFGLAIAATDLRLTRTGAPMGSVWYMSPEQVTASSTIDKRTDIYSLGAVLYEILTGRKLFDLDTAFAVMQSHVGMVPAPPSQRNRYVPPGLDDIVLKALQKEPNARFQSAEEFKLALERTDLTGVLFTQRPKMEIGMTSSALKVKENSARFSPFDAAIAATLVMTSMVAGVCGVHWFPPMAVRRMVAQSQLQNVAPGPALVPVATAETAVAASPAPDPPTPVVQAESTPPVQVERETVKKPARSIRRPKDIPQIRVTGGEVEHAEIRSVPVSARVKPEPTPPPIEAATPSPPAADVASDHKLPVSDTPGTSVPAASAPAATKAPKTGNRFLRMLGKIVPFREGGDHDTGAAKSQTGKN